jgi:DNA-binding transcriptional LysR family regulator
MVQRIIVNVHGLQQPKRCGQGGSMSIRALTYFLVAAEELNFTKAAGKLYVTQQTLSNHIKRLEEQYDVQLFNRYPRLRLTPSGECMVRYATRILRLERAMNAEFADLSQNTSGVLFVGCSRMRGKYYLPKIWSVYRQKYPNIEIRMLEGNSDFLMSELLAHKLDICIGMNVSDLLEITFEPLITEQVYLVINRDLFKKQLGEAAEEKARQFYKGVRCSDLLQIPLLLQPQSNYIRKIINQSYEAFDVIPRAIFESNDSELLCNMSIAGNGGAFLPESGFLLPVELIKYKLPHLYAFPLIDVKVSSMIAYPKNSPQLRYLQEFIAVCHQVFNDTQSRMRELGNLPSEFDQPDPTL